MTLSTTCARCGGALYLDDDAAGNGLAPALACFMGCSRVELDRQGKPLAVAQLFQRRGHPMEQRIRVMRVQGFSLRRISQELRCSERLVAQVVAEG